MISYWLLNTSQQPIFRIIMRKSALTMCNLMHAPTEDSYCSQGIYQIRKPVDHTITSIERRSEIRLF